MMTTQHQMAAPRYQPRWSPAPRRAHFLGTPARLGQDVLGLSVVTAGLVGIGLSAASIYAGLYTGTHAKGFGSVVGWVVGVLGILGGIGTLLTLAGIGVLAAQV